VIELPDFVTPKLIERTYKRSLELRALGERHSKARPLLVKGMNMARARHPRMLAFLEKGAEHLQSQNQAQQARFRHNESGVEYKPSEFSEYATWRTAYEKVLEPGADERTLFRIWGWIYAAVAEALGA
jgi:hypothetical protein